ncbi:MAG TPA: hypothetical protein VLK89_05610 [Solirubrobacterales bacterium]|nr:hypothetical protein [Solirubrobacterales bacterium]
MTSNAGTPPRYNLALVTQVILEEAVDIDPEHLTVGELSLRIVTDPNDDKEVEIATQAIRDLRQSGLFRYGDDDQVVEPTPAALLAYELLA